MSRLKELEDRLRDLKRKEMEFRREWLDYKIFNYRTGAPLDELNKLNRSIHNTYININQEKQRIEKREREEARWREKIITNEEDAAKVIYKYIDNRKSHLKDICEFCTHKEEAENNPDICSTSGYHLNCNYDPKPVDFSSDNYYY